MLISVEYGEMSLAIFCFIKLTQAITIFKLYIVCRTRRIYAIISNELETGSQHNF